MARVRYTRNFLRFVLPGMWVLLLSAVVHAQTPTRFAYAVNTANNSISVLGVDVTTGALTELATVPSGTAPLSVIVDPSARFAYAVNSGSNTVSAFRITEAVPGLAAVQAVASGGVRPVAIVAEPTGRFVYVANAGTGISRFTIAANGTLVRRQSETVGRPTALVAHPSGRFLFAINATPPRINAFAIDIGTGGLTLLDVAPTSGTNPVALTIEPRGRFLYVIDRAGRLVDTFRLNPTSGALTLIQTESVKDPAGLTVDRTGRFLYVASPDNSAVFGFNIGSNGALTSAGATVLGPNGASSITIDPTGRFAYVANAGTPSITQLRLNTATGGLTEGDSISTGQQPAGIAIAHPLERFLFETAWSGQTITIEAFASQPATGAVSSIEDLIVTTSGLSTYPAIEGTGRFVYALENSEDITAFRIEPGTGQLTQIQTMGFPPEAGGSTALTADPTGRFLYVACVCNSLDTRIRIFSINPITGLLTDAGGGGGPGNFFTLAGGAVDPSGRFLYIAGTENDVIEAFATNPSDGGVTAIGTTPTSPSARDLAIDPLGRFLFLGSGAVGSGVVEAFRIGASGVLTPAGSVVFDDDIVRTVDVDRTGRFLFVGVNNGDMVTLAVNQANGTLTAGIPPASLGPLQAGPLAAVVDATGRFLHVGYGGANGAGIRTFRINPTDGSLTTVDDATTVGSPQGIVAPGPFR